LTAPLAPQASVVTDPPGSVAGGAFHGCKSSASYGGECHGCDDESFFHCVLLKLTPAFLCLVTDARGTMPQAGRLTPMPGIMVPAGKAKTRTGTLRNGDCSHHGFVGIGKISRNIFAMGGFFPMLF